MDLPENGITVPEISDGDWADAPLARSRWNHAMKWVRRIHLYSGLFMFPFVVLYGATGFLFNHPSAFSDIESPREFDQAMVADTPLANLPQPRDLANQVVTAIEKAERAKGNQAPFRLMPDEEPRFARPQAVVTAKNGENRYGASVFLDNGAGSVRTFKEASPAPAQSSPFVDHGLKIDAPLDEQLRQGVPGVLEKLNLKSDEIASVSIPDLLFRMEVDGKIWHVAYNVQRGTLVASEHPPEAMPTRRFLTRLHMAHGYPDRIGLRWFWALAVDAMFVAMIFWGVSGLFMWWQIKKTRFWGILLFLISAIFSTVLFAGMHQNLSSLAAIKEAPKSGDEIRSKSDGTGKGSGRTRTGMGDVKQ